jgi:D-sedoheptulose 7-phosphate isomerase
VVAISSSGKSLNIVQAAYAAREAGARLITLSGFDAMNPLRQLGEHNYYVPSFNYGIVEIAHLAILHSLAKPS